jgi:hypothetical protein
MTGVVVRGSEIQTYRQCPLLWKIRWDQEWDKPENSFASDLGTAWHLVMGTHYLAIQDHQREGGKLKLTRAQQQNVLDTVDAVIAERVAEEFREIIDWMYDGHIDQYGFDDAWEVLHVEEHKVVPWPAPHQIDLVPSELNLQFFYSWTSDLVVRDHSMQHKPALVVDNKSTGNLLGQDDIDLSDQLGMYTWAERQDGVKVLAPWIRQAHTKKLKRAQTLNERFKSLPSYRTDIELNNVAREMLDIAVRLHTDPRPYSSPDPRTCSWKCPHRDVHLYMRRRKDPHEIPVKVLRARGYVQRAVPSGHDQIKKT